MSIFRIARYAIRPETTEACKAFIRDTVAYTEAHEPGTLLYMVLQDADEPTHFVHISAYEDEAALARHISGEPMTTGIREILHPAMTGPVEFTQYTMVDAKVDAKRIAPVALTAV